MKHFLEIVMRSYTAKLLAITTSSCLLTLSVLAETDVLSFSRIGTFPSNRELSGENADSENANGIAYNGTHWFYANQWNIYRLSSSFQSADDSINIASYRLEGVKCNHIGGIDSYDGEIYAALDNCSDNEARVLVLDDEYLFVKRFAILPQLRDSFPWVAVNPMNDDFFYALAPDKRSLLAFERDFENNEIIRAIKEETISFIDHPQDVLDHFWTQGGAFSENGLFLRTVDDAKDEYSAHTGVWIYELGKSSEQGLAASRVGFINIRYDPDMWVPGACWFDQCERNYELEDLDATSISTGNTKGDVHIIMLSEEAGEDDVSVFHYLSGDFDQDGSRDLTDNCIWDFNPSQKDQNANGIGDACEAFSEDFFGRSFRLLSEFGNHEVIDFGVLSAVKISIEAEWEESEPLALILNGPGQTSYFARQDGNSPLRVDYEVTQADIARGDNWQASIVNFSQQGPINGLLRVALEKSFRLSQELGDREIIDFQITEPGSIILEAEWEASESLSLILNGPGQTGYYARKDGDSPLRIEYEVTQADIAKGNDWRISIVNFSQQRDVSGSFRVSLY
jgi:hypothetical protein